MRDNRYYRNYRSDRNNWGGHGCWLGDGNHGYIRLLHVSYENDGWRDQRGYLSIEVYVEGLVSKGVGVSVYELSRIYKACNSDLLLRIEIIKRL